MTKLHDLAGAGQSVWLDFIRRAILESGELERLVAAGVRGLTSNPTIFQQAIAGSDDYDAAIASFLDAHPGAPPLAVYEHLAIADVRNAADLLGAVYEESGGADGYVSLEVSPHLAHDTAGTVSEALRLWEAVDRPNLMIKVPATPAGIPALEDLIAAGINVNSTLMFSMQQYEDVAQAYVRGLRRAEHPDRIGSVASFFVSRVDTKTDARLEKVGSDAALELRGRTAVANSKLVYRRYKEIFDGAGFAPLRSGGARPQRALWASTSTKNPAYSDVLYVESLIGPGTVNTLPPATLDAFIDHGRVIPGAVEHDVEAATADLAALDEVGVDLDSVTAELQEEGVAAFAASFDDLLAALGAKIESMSP